MIRVREVRLIDDTGKQIGIVPTGEALSIAQEKGFDLVEISPNANPPVCKIMDYGKYKYMQHKKAQEAKKKQTVIQVKEIKMRPRIDTHDFNVKVKHIEKFLNEGAKVKVNIFLRGREIENADTAFKLIEMIKEHISEIGTLDNKPKLEGRVIHVIISPIKQKK
jgi:translation initiation factor IF-3